MHVALPVCINCTVMDYWLRQTMSLGTLFTGNSIHSDTESILSAIEIYFATTHDFTSLLFTVS